MICTDVRRNLSALRDGDLKAAAAREMGAHLESCAGCAAHERAWTGALDALGAVPRLHPEETIASAVLHQLEVESRGPGLALVFRSALAARPLMLPSLVPACLVLVSVIGLALLGTAGAPAWPSGRLEAWDKSLPASGTEGNPLPPTSDVSAPRALQGAVFSDQVLAAMGDVPVFLETVVARDGSVSSVNLLGGDSAAAGPLLAALRQERFSPGRLHGRPVAVSLYRLISRTDVRAPLT
jgi:hypothetical protein